jgi:hypothetical protein
MRRFLIAGVALSFASGCVGTQIKTESRRDSVSAKLPVEQHGAAFERALAAFNARGEPVTQSDPAAGIIRTEAQSTWMSCANTVDLVCSAYESSQLTMSSDGIVFLRRSWQLSGRATLPEEDMQTRADKAVAHAELEAFLRYVMGDQPEVPAPRSPAPRALPPLPPRPAGTPQP